MQGKIIYKTEYLSVTDEEKVAIHQIQVESQTATNRPVVLMLHGAIENSKIFFSRSGKGLAPFLARHGYCVYALDFRGRGDSIPAIAKGSSVTQLELIEQDIPLTINHLWERHNCQPMAIVAHSWGGVMMSAALVRDSSLKAKISSLSYFVTKRSVGALTPEAILKVHIVWNRLAFYFTKRDGFLAAKKIGMGSDNETVRTHSDSVFWVKHLNKWIDPSDHFDYKAAFKDFAHPPLLSITGASDKALGHPKDCQRFLNEISSGTL